MSAVHPMEESPARSAPEMPLSKLQAALLHIERAMAEHYQWLAMVFRADACTRTFFEAMARAEREHEQLVTLGFRLAGNRSSTTVAADINDLLEAFDDASRFRASTPRPTLKQALEFSLCLEGHAAEQHIGAVLAHVDPPLADLIERLAAGDRRHTQALREFLDGQAPGCWRVAAHSAAEPRQACGRAERSYRIA